MKKDLFNGKVALITGSTRGIGKSIAVSLALAGAKVIIHGRADESVEKVVKELKSQELDASGLSADFSDLSNAENLADKIIQKFGRLDFLIHNAAITHMTPTENVTAEECEKIMKVNVSAPLLITKKFVPVFEKQKSGRIIFMSSVSGLNGRIGGAGYAASKSALVGLARSFAKELGQYGVTVNIIAPGLIETDGLHRNWDDGSLDNLARLTPVKRLGKTKDIADLVVFLVSDEASFVTGNILFVDGGLSLV